MGEFLFWRDKLRAETRLREITQTIGIYGKDTGHLQNLKETSRPQKETGPETQTLLLSYVSDFRFLSLSLSLWTSFIYFSMHKWKNPVAETYKHYMFHLQLPGK